MHALAKTRFFFGAGRPESGLLSAYVSGKGPNGEEVCILAGLAGWWPSTLGGSGGTRIRLVNVTSGVMRAVCWGLGG